MEGDEPNPPSRPKDCPLYEYSAHVAESVAGFKQFIGEVFEEFEQDESFSAMTVESYEHKKTYIRKLLLELLSTHNMLGDHFVDLIQEVSKKCPFMTKNPHLKSADSTSPEVTQTLAPRFSTATGYDLLLKPDGGGFYLAKAKSLSHSSSENLEDEVETTKDREALLEKISSLEDEVMSLKQKVERLTVEKGQLQWEIDEILEDVKRSMSESKQEYEKISSLEDEVMSLKQKVERLTVENGELKWEIDENLDDVKLYMSGSKQEYETLEEELKRSQDIVKSVNAHMAGVLADKVANESKHLADVKEMNQKIIKYVTEFESEKAQLKATHEKREKIWNGVLEKLRSEVKEKSELVNQVKEQMNIVVADKSSQNTRIHHLETELASVKSENEGVLSAFDNVQKFIDELKLKVVEVEKGMQRQRGVLSKKE